MSRTLTVYANPYAALDHLGRPAGAVARDRIHDRPGYVGAAVVATDVEALPKGHAGTPSQDTRFEFEAGPIVLPNADYYRRAVRRGELFAGDEATAQACGVPLTQPAFSLTQARDEAAAKWRAATGEDAPFAESKSGAKKPRKDEA